MGTPGYYILCPNGHQIGVIENGLSWSEETLKKLEELENEKCPICGQKAKYNFCHYGNINDCTEANLVWNPEENRWIIPKRLTEEQKKELKGHVIRKDVTIKTEIVAKKKLVETDIQPQEATDKMSLLLEGDNVPKKSGSTFLYEKAATQKKKIGELGNKECETIVIDEEYKETGTKTETKTETDLDVGNKNAMGIDKIYIDQQKDTDILEIVNKILVNSKLKKVTPTLLFRMVKARKRNGWTYSKIQDAFNVGQWSVINYLRNIKPDKGAILGYENLRKILEKRAMEILVNDKFTDIINLGEICPKGHFDFIAFKGKDKWLISVTVGNPQELRNKSTFLRVIPGFICAILYMVDEFGPYNLIELKNNRDKRIVE